jgi:hypothetical protein
VFDSAEDLVGEDGRGLGISSVVEGFMASDLAECSIIGG